MYLLILMHRISQLKKMVSNILSQITSLTTSVYAQMDVEMEIKTNRGHKMVKIRKTDIQDNMVMETRGLHKILQIIQTATTIVREWDIKMDSLLPRVVNMQTILFLSLQETELQYTVKQQHNLNHPTHLESMMKIYHGMYNHVSNKRKRKGIIVMSFFLVQKSTFAK